MVVMKNCEPLLQQTLAGRVERMPGCLRVGAGVGHGQKEGLLVPELEVLVGKLLAVDGLAASALRVLATCTGAMDAVCIGTHIATGEVSALEHEVGDDAVELGAGIAKALLASRESAEVLDRLRDNIVEELEVDAASLICTATMSAIALHKLQQWLSDGIAIH